MLKKKFIVVKRLVDYELKVNKRGVKYANKIDLKTGKKSKIKYKTAQKRISGLKHSRKKAKIIASLKKEGAGGTYKEYQKTYKKLEKEIVQKRKERKQKPLTPNALRSQTKKWTIKDRTGVATRLRYAWVYWFGIESMDDQGNLYLEKDTTPVFEANALFRNGDYFDTMCEICQETYDSIMGYDLYEHPEGGACVIMYHKSDKSVIRKFELGKGCGFSFDFKSFSKKKDEEYDEYY